jgi:hypothetical protein
MYFFLFILLSESIIFPFSIKISHDIKKASIKSTFSSLVIEINLKSYM